MRSLVSGRRWGRQLAIDGGEELKVANGLPSSVGYTGRSDEALRPERRTTEALNRRLYLSAMLGHAAAMKKRANVVLAALILAALGLAMREGLRPKEPVYDGRPVSYWINYSGRADVALDLGRIGRFTGDSNAVPYLVEALRRHEDLFSRIYCWTLPRTPNWMKRRLPPPVLASAVRWSTARSLGRMGVDAKPAIPALIRTLSEDELIGVRVEAARSLGRLGENDAMVVLALTEALKDPSPAVCLAAATELTDADAARPEVAAALHKYAGHTNSWVRRCATDLLQRVSAPDRDPGDR